MRNNSATKKEIPIIFEKNIGQHKNEAQYVLKSNNGTTFFLDKDVVFAVRNPIEKKNINDNENSVNIKTESNDSPEEILKRTDEYEVDIVRMSLDGADENPAIEGCKKYNCGINYFIGSDESKWITNVPIYSEIIYRKVYPGIDVRYYGRDGVLEHDFIVYPDGDASSIKMRFSGDCEIKKDAEGNAIISNNTTVLKMLKPRAYQNIGNTEEEIESSFIIDGSFVKINVADYDKSRTLIIDPAIIYSSYLGGNADDCGKGIAVDQNGIAYITGYTASTSGFPLSENAYQGTLKSANDIFLIKIDTNKSGTDSLLYGSYFGGTGDDKGTGVAIDKNGFAYITGSTTSKDFPTTKYAYQEFYSEKDPHFDQAFAFIIKINTNTSSADGLLYCSYLGGYSADYGQGIAVDIFGYAYITGYTFSRTSFPISSNAYQATNNSETGVYCDAFIIKMDTNTKGPAALMYGSYLGGSNSDYGNDISVDTHEIAYIVGATESNDFPLSSTPYQNHIKGSSNAFIAKFHTTPIPSSDTLLYSSYLGGNGFDSGNGIAVDNGIAYITGQTSSSSHFPLLNAYQGTLSGNSDAFLIKFDTTKPGTDALLYGSYLGGNNDTIGWSIAIDNGGDAYITGHTSSSSGFPLLNPYQAALKGTGDAFLIKIDTNESGTNSLKYGSYLGGYNPSGEGFNNTDVGYGIAIDHLQNVYITGQTFSSLEFPLFNEYQNKLKGSSDAFLIKMNVSECELILEKYCCQCVAKEGDIIPFILKVTNNGPYDASNIVVTDILDSNLKLHSYNTASGTINSSGNTITWIIPGIPADSSAIAMITAIASTGNIYVSNTASLTSVNTLLDTSITESSSMIYIAPAITESSELILEKSSCKCSADSGDVVPFTLKVTNNGPNSVYGIIVTDVLDSNLTFDSCSTISGTISGTGNTVTWILPSINAGNSVTAIVTATALNPDGTGIFAKNTASLVTEAIIADTSITESSSMIYIAPAKAVGCELILEKSSCKCSVESGDVVPFTLKVINSGPASASNVTVTDTLDSNLTFESCSTASGTISGTGNTVTWTIPSIPVGNSIVATVTAKAASTVNAAGIFANNTASLTSTTTLSNSSITKSSSQIFIEPTKGCKLILEKSSPNNTAKSGDTIPFTIRVTNNGPGAAANVTVTDVLDSNLTFNSCSAVSGTISNKGNTVTWTIPSIPEGSSLTAVVTAIANTLVPDNIEGIYAKNTASLTSTTPLSDTSITESSSLIFVNAVNASELIIDKSTCKCLAEDGDTIPFVLKVTNNGPIAASNVIVTDVLDPNQTLNSFSSKTGTMSAIGNTVTWNIPEIPSGTSVYAIVTAIAGLPSTAAASNTGSIINTGILLESSASLTSLTPLSETSVIESSSLVFVMPVSGCELILDKSAPASTAEGEDVIPFTLKVTNNGPNAASNVIVTDVLDSNLTFDSCSAVSGTISGTGNTVTWTIPTIAAGSSAVATITATAVSPSTSTAGIYAKNTASLTSSTALSSTSITESSSLIFIKSVQIFTPCDLIVNMWPSKNSYLNCENIIYKIRLKNNGPETALNISVIDSIDSRLNILSLKVSSGTISNSGNIVTWTIDELVPGEEAGCIIIAQPNQTLINTQISNTATASCSNGILNSSNSTSSANIMICAVPCC